MKHIAAVGLLLFFAVLVPRNARAQEDPPIYGGDSCNLLIYMACGSGGYHEIVGGGGSGGTDHGTTCYYCSTGVAADCHPWCANNLDASTKMAYLGALKAGEEGDVARVIALGQSTHGLVVFNQRRQSVQIKTCSGKLLIANLPVPRSQLQLAALLPRDGPGESVAAAGVR